MGTVSRHSRLIPGIVGLVATAVAVVGAPGAQGRTVTAQPAAPASITGTVQSVVSGERIKVRQGKRTLIVTLAGVDAPTGRECFAAQSRTGVRTLVPKGTRVTVTVVSRKGRKVQGQVRAGSTDLNEAVVGAGLAESDGSIASLDAAAATARSAGLGLYGLCGGGAPAQDGGTGGTPGGGNGTGDSGSTGAERPAAGSSTSPTSYTAAEKEEIRARYERNLVGLELSFSTGDGSVTDTYGISFCSRSVYSLFQITSFSGSGSTSSQHAGSWRIADVGGVPQQSEIVRVAYTPAEPGRDPFFTDIAQYAGGQVLVNNRQAGVGSATSC